MPEELYDLKKVREAISRFSETASELDLNLLELFKACEYVKISAKAEMLRNVGDIERAEELLK